MAIGSSSSSKRKKSKRPSSDPSSSPMAPSSSSSSSSQSRIKAASRYKTYIRKRSSIPLLVALPFLLLLLYITWKRVSGVESDPKQVPRSGPKIYTFDVVNEFPHDPNAFTQGLLYGGNDTLFESTGLYGRSSVRQVYLDTGKVQVSQRMDNSEFGEGLALLGERLYQVTWLKQTGFIYDRYDFSKQKKFTHPMKDGWGLATDGEIIFGSDGSSTLYQLDPVTWKALHKVTVKYNGHEIPLLNELEYVNGEVWANVWQTDCIARISKHDGVVCSWILLHELRRGLIKAGYNGIDVLNGIAWDEENNRLFVTGKLWPKLYEIKLRRVTTPLHRKIENLCSIGA